MKMGNVVKGAGDLIAIPIALDLSLFGRTKSLTTGQVKEIQERSIISGVKDIKPSLNEIHIIKVGNQ